MERVTLLWILCTLLNILSESLISVKRQKNAENHATFYNLRESAEQW